MAFLSPVIVLKIGDFFHMPCTDNEWDEDETFRIFRLHRYTMERSTIEGLTGQLYKRVA